ncbi:putative GTP pyrophosphokinase [Sinobaca qinghaiensis]|uniref:Putative GTP pyrophosphokinase n=1 Tax=Sinobaca qinghaiensis TaxID=342944 RepID=A0A419V4S2_9BACL|nr:GTP pyrophosphokinase family protein [Sinobaca qinghaiensis]RKD73441.1 putative GTP pyrophosphokinase [Sinobaca qinghaiensis]
MQTQETNWDICLMKRRFALREMETRLNILNEEFKVMHQHNPIDHIVSRIKSQQAIEEKLRRKGFSVSEKLAERYIRDIAGLRIICSFTDDVYHISRLLEQQADLRLTQKKDYIENPKPNGYQSLHLIIEVPVNRTTISEMIQVEVQIRTMAMDVWASLEHKMYYKFRHDVPKYLQNNLKESAQILYELDEKMNTLKKEINMFHDLPSIRI